MKTARQWADHLPEPIRTQFLDNCERPERKHASLDDAIVKQFLWDLTPEGQGVEYWSGICNKAFSGHYDNLAAASIADDEHKES